MPASTEPVREAATYVGEEAQGGSAPTALATITMPSPGLRPPTQRQLAVLAFIAHHRAQHGFVPTVREMGRALGFVSTNAGADFLKILERKGLIERNGPRGRHAISRGYSLTDLGRKLSGYEQLSTRPAAAVVHPVRWCYLCALATFQAICHGRATVIREERS
jgi:hypothetical protein